MKIAIIGTRGIPNHYGGFEQFAEYLSLGLVQRGHSVTVYNSHKHPFQEITWNGVDIKHCFDPEHRLGTIGQFIYDFNCIKSTRNKNFDIILQLGYTSSSVWGWLLPAKKSVITTNMDGLEWKRTKFSTKVQKFLLFAELLAVKTSHYLISDSIGIQDYIYEKYNKKSLYIPYGAHLFKNPDIQVLVDYKVVPHEYNMLIARLEPENSIEPILDGVVSSESKAKFLVIGKHETKFGEYLKTKFQHDERIQFIGGVYNIEALNNLRHFSNIYFHGHTVGGTNPSLLEAMASQSLICANDNIFNKSILKEDALYFKNKNDVKMILDSEYKNNNSEIISNNEQKIKNTYNWDCIIDQYEKHFFDILIK